jgi:hypothetical protein
MKHISTSAEFNGQHSFVEKNASTDKKRQHDREMYSLMSDEQKHERLRKNREYKKCKHGSETIFTQQTTPAMKAQSSKHYQTGIVILSDHNFHHLLLFYQLILSIFNCTQHFQVTQIATKILILLGFLSQLKKVLYSKVKYKPSM